MFQPSRGSAAHAGARAGAGAGAGVATGTGQPRRTRRSSNSSTTSDRTSSSSSQQQQQQQQNEQQLQLPPVAPPMFAMPRAPSPSLDVFRSGAYASGASGRISPSMGLFTPSTATSSNTSVMGLPVLLPPSLAQQQQQQQQQLPPLPLPPPPMRRGAGMAAASFTRSDPQGSFVAGLSTVADNSAAVRYGVAPISTPSNPFASTPATSAATATTMVSAAESSTQPPISFQIQRRRGPVASRWSSTRSTDSNDALFPSPPPLISAPAATAAATAAAAAPPLANPTLHSLGVTMQSEAVDLKSSLLRPSHDHVMSWQRRVFPSLDPVVVGLGFSAIEDALRHQGRLDIGYQLGQQNRMTKEADSTNSAALQLVHEDLRAAAATELNSALCWM
ncbi:hypothetical protein GQ42DRAFT_152638 [Ramicandelaber brevisporus]|nr:hypothetical protein GQ42DRAFT_152638 [Ramicandelaber brevisporus]